MSDYLNSLSLPGDLKDMSYDELELLTYEIRDFLVDKVSRTGGHLSSNLGAVELSIAIHRAFDTPKDKVIWDVGHQTYVHKILTGRADNFDTLRQMGGMSGFPKKSESPFDTFDTGHSSSSISVALGMAAARDISGDDYEVISVIGDGAMTGGLSFEALNNVGNLNSKVIVILNDNGMSISHNTGGFPKYLGKLRSSRPVYIGQGAGEARYFTCSADRKGRSLRDAARERFSEIRHDRRRHIRRAGIQIFRANRRSRHPGSM